MNSTDLILRGRGLVKQACEQLLARAPRAVRAGSRLILSYHNVVASKSGPLGDNSLHLRLESFERQLRLIRNEADVVSVPVLLASSDSRSRLVAITFDDAYSSALIHGVALCSIMSLPSCVFIAPGILGTAPTWDRRAMNGRWSASEREHFLWSEQGYCDHERDSIEIDSRLRIATYEQLERLRHDPFVSIGNHTWSHANLGSLEPEQVRVELTRAQVWIESHFGNQAIRATAYPYGIPPRSPDAALQAVGLNAGMLVTGGWMSRGRMTLSALPRWNVPAEISDQGFRARLRGWML